VVNGIETQTTCLADYDQLLRSLDTLVKEINRLNQSTTAAEILIAEPEDDFEVFPKEHIKIPRNQVGFVLRFPNQPLPESDIDDLFRPFRHSDPKHRGLGLCTAHRIIESHKGEIRVVNQSQHGLALLILMPSTTAQADNIALTTHEKSILEVEPA
jgi:signal transduction histidine kinase